MKRIKRFDFARAVVETRILERNMIPLSAFESMLSMANVEDIQTQLRSAGYPMERQELERNNFDDLLRISMERFVEEIITISPDPAYLDIFCLEYDIYNIKCLLLKSQKDSQFEGSSISIPRERAQCYAALAAGEPLGIGAGDYFTALYEEMKELQAEEGSKAVQEELDRRYYGRLLEIAKASEIEQYTKYAKAKVDFYNILVMLRMRRIAARHAIDLPKEAFDKMYERIVIAGGLIPKEDVIDMHAKSNDQLILLFDSTPYRTYLLDGMLSYGYDMELSGMEKQMDNYLTELLKESQYTSLGPEPVLGYLHGRRMEILNFRLVLTSVFLGVPAHTVRERLRECYA